ncbi:MULTISPECIES: hypothetical protein [Thermosipho]|uniref:hypothetical protein n=1 Tax=Thermosipho TaxID=2420 RepID=UPI00094940FB|nr:MULTISPECIES: hypothetical protein [Thermosipho]ANQ54297.1 hypothetical protein Y592_07795 [Thermosipho sp. 1070]
MIYIKKITILITFFLISISFSGIFEFVENTSGFRDFFVDVSVNFDVIDKNGTNFKNNISFEATILNLEHFDILIKSPEFLKDINIEANTLNSATYYKYKNYTISNISDFDINLVYEIIMTTSSFLSSSLFTIFEKGDNLSLIPAGYTFLKRLGLEPTKILVKFNNNKLKEILFTTDKSTESISVKFEKFEILKGDYK